MKCSFLTSVFIIVLVAACNAQCQEATEAKHDYLTTPFDPSAKQLPPGFVGHDAQRIYESLAKKFTPKGEFESTQQFQERQRLEEQKPLFGELTMKSLFASTISFHKVQVTYDADAELLKYKVPFAPENSKEELHDISLRLNVISKKSVVATVVGYDYVCHEHEEEFSSLVRNLKDFGIPEKDSIYSLGIELPLKADTAKTAKENIRILILYHLAGTLLDAHTLQRKDSASRVVALLDLHNFRSDIEDVWFYNIVTGEIYKKLKSADKPKVEAAKVNEKAEAQRKAAAEAAEWHTWKDASGKHEIEAKFGGMISGNVKLTKKDGSIIRIPLEKLSDDDQKWIEDRKKQ